MEHTCLHGSVGMVVFFDANLEVYILTSQCELAFLI